MRARITSVLMIAASVLLILAVGTLAHAQEIEIHPYAGGFFPAGEWAGTTPIHREGIYGLRGGVYLTENVQLDGNFGYLNHFRFKGNSDAGTRGFLWDVNGSYTFSSASLRKAEPFFTFGLGALTTDVRNSTTAIVEEMAPLPLRTQQRLRVMLMDPAIHNPGTTRGPVILEDGDTFLTLNYGGGIKGRRLWGPVGLRADFRGRTLPNFYGHNLTWLELTGGVNFMWGER